jgi:hypothetical protein
MGTPEGLIAKMLDDLHHGPIPLITGRQVGVVGPAERLGPGGDMPQSRLEAAFAALAEPGDKLIITPLGASARIMVSRRSDDG